MMPTTKINVAIRDCISRCRGNESPLSCLASFVDELRHAGWSEAELRVVEKAVVRLLDALIDPPPIQPASCPKCAWPSPIVLIRGVEETMYRCSDCQHQWQEATATA